MERRSGDDLWRRVERLFLLASACALLPSRAMATPTTVFLAPSAAVQPFAMLHATYDTWFWPGSGRSAAHPTALGLTAGVLPFDQVRLELGFDFILPSRDPLVLNAKLGSPEGALFPGSPAWAIGIFDAGVTGATALDVGYAVLGKRTLVGTFSAGGYLGSERLLRSAEGSSERAGLLAAVVFPSIAVGRPWLDSVDVRWDVLSGRNVLGATGGGVALSLTPYAIVRTGPVFYFEPFLQPGAASFLWTVMLNVDVDLAWSRRAAAPHAN